MKRRAFLAAVAAPLAPAVRAADPPRLGPNEGEVLEIDAAQDEIVIRHGPLPELDMPPMAMALKVADRSFLHKVRKGDRVRFKAGLVGGRFGVIAIERIGPPSAR